MLFRSDDIFLPPQLVCDKVVFNIRPSQHGGVVVFCQPSSCTPVVLQIYSSLFKTLVLTQSFFVVLWGSYIFHGLSAVQPDGIDVFPDGQ